MLMIAESSGTQIAHTYPIVIKTSGLAPSISGSGVVWFVELSGDISWPKIKGGLVINTTPEIMKIVMADLK
jgi:hypothetical protein